MTATYVGVNPEKWNVVKRDGRWAVFEPGADRPAVSFRGWHAAMLYALHNAKHEHS
jgi:hypothetical protein